MRCGAARGARWLAVLCGAARGQAGRLRHGSALRRAPPPSIGGQEGRRGPPLFPMPGGDDVDAEARLGGSGDGEGGSGRCEGGSGRGEGGSIGDGGDGAAGPQRLLVFTVGAFGGGGGTPQVSLPHVDLAPFLLPGRIWSEAASPSIPAATKRIHGETAPTYGNGADPAGMTSPAADPARPRPPFWPRPTPALAPPLPRADAPRPPCAVHRRPRGSQPPAVVGGGRPAPTPGRDAAPLSHAPHSSFSSPSPSQPQQQRSSRSAEHHRRR
ncbi:uncharacterized protein [Miscanthus floridulus]|uniref:uncharacterized protein n=1 Tax=Miscanthus floridulus TaxID=154761 RepID=UPI003457679C